MAAQPEWPVQPGSCLDCGGELEPAHGTLEYELDDMTVRVEGVPMLVCESCGRRIVPGRVGITVTNLARSVVESIRRTENEQDAVGAADAITIHYREEEEAEPRELVSA